MSDIVIKAEGIGKSYLIGHKSNERYESLRDVVADKTKELCSKIRSPHCHARKDIEEFWALKDVSFEVKRGERIGVIGRNGAGKSTLLKVLSRITEPTTGRVSIKVRVASLLEVGTGFHPELTGRENIFLNGAILGMTRREIRGKFDEIVDFAEVEKFLDTPVKRFSSGMYVRLAFAVAAHLEPEILVVDEVLAVGDAEFQKKCLGKMNEVAQKGRTVLFVSHNMGAIRSLCTYGLLLEKGQLIMNDTASQVVDTYASMSALHADSLWDIADDPELPLQVTSVKAVDACGQICSRFDVNDPIDLIIKHRCHEPLTGSVVLVSIYHNAVELIHSFDADSFLQRLDRREIGEYVDCIHLPAGLFKAGVLTVSIRTAIVNKNTTFQDHADVIRVELDDLREDTSFKGYAVNRAGLLRVSPKWESKRIDVGYTARLGENLR